MQSPQRQVAQRREEPKPDDSDLPLAARRGRRSTKKRRYHLSDFDEADDDHAQATAPPQDQVTRNVHQYPSAGHAVTAHGIMPPMGMLPSLAPQLYLQGACMPAGCQQLPDYYTLAHDPFASGFAGPCGPLPLMHDQIYAQGTAQGMPAWEGQVPIDPSLGHHSQGVLSTGGSASMGAPRDSAAMMHSQNPFRSSVRSGDFDGLDSILHIAPLGALSQQNAPLHTRHF